MSKGVHSYQLAVKGPVKLKIEEIQKKIAQNRTLVLSDFEINYDLEYYFKAYKLGKSNNILFCIEDELFLSVIDRINFDISTVIDNNDNNVLHYAIFRHNVELIHAILRNARLRRNIHLIVNHRNKDGTNPLGMAFVHHDFFKEIEIATLFLNVPEYNINDYLNNKKFMDYSSLKQIGGTNLLHNVILTAIGITFQEFHNTQDFASFFDNLLNRIDRESRILNPYYPIANSKVQWMNTESLLSEKFKSTEVKGYIKSKFGLVFKNYKKQQDDDDSGDSDDEDSHAHKYKKMLVDLNNTIKDCLKIDGEEKLRSFEKYEEEYASVPQKFLNEESFEKFWREKNYNMLIQDGSYDSSIYKDITDSIVVPLFHGVPFMDSQYTNYQRRKVVEKIFQVNEKLLDRLKTDGEHEELNEFEKILIGIHSRTSTATVGIQSLYDLMTARIHTLNKLNDVNDDLLNFFRENNSLQTLKSTMHHYIFKFSESDSVKSFWESYTNDVVPEDIVKSRFPKVATSKAPDHAIRFAVGRNIAAMTKDPMIMRPEYHEGRPKHRVAGLIYVTLHKLSDLIRRRNEHTMIDINQGLKRGEIENSPGSDRIMFQNECNFLGKIDSDNVIGVVPVVYPNEQSADKFDVSYHQDIFGLDESKRSIFDQRRVKIFNKAKVNPSIITDPAQNNNVKISEFGALMVPTVVNLANGLATAYAKRKNLLLCTIDDRNKLKFYPVHFEKCQNSSNAQQTSHDTKNNLVPNRLWEYVAVNPKQEEQVPIKSAGDSLIIFD